MISAQSKMSTKKCACFTPSGLVYTRLETDGTIARRLAEVSKQNGTRTRRSIDNEVYEPNTVDSILKENPSIGHLNFKNEPIDELESRNTKDKIDKLIKETEAFLEAYERTKENIDHKRIKRRAQHWNHNKHKKNDAIVNSNESSLECKIEKDGTVNCSQIIYNDLKAWHTNRLSLEDQIRQLRTKLEDLKEIKRHLKIAKPVTETQTVHPAFISNHLFNKSLTHEHNTSKEHFRKSRPHRVKPKHKNSTALEKKSKHPNEELVSTIVANTKDDVINIQFKNETKTEAPTVQTLNITSDTDTAMNNTEHSIEIQKPQVTTIIIEGNYEQNSVEQDKSTLQSVITSTESIVTTDFAIDVTTKRVSEENSTDEGYFSQNVNYLSSAIDKFLSTEKSTSTPSKPTTAETTTTSRPTTTAPRHMTLSPLSLGPARLDASEYEQRNPNKATKNMGIFEKPADVFQRRLHPLFIENEDKHVCYCEENRLVLNNHNSIRGFYRRNGGDM